jgi:hypothetical protein
VTKGSFLAQKISIAIQRGNAASLLGTFSMSIGEEQLQRHLNRFFLFLSVASITYKLFIVDKNVSNCFARRWYNRLYEENRSNRYL